MCKITQNSRKTKLSCKRKFTIDYLITLGDSKNVLYVLNLFVNFAENAKRMLLSFK